MDDEEPIESAERETWRRAYRALQTPGSPDCPDEATLVALALGEDPGLPVAEREALGEHIVSCRRCAALYRDLLDLDREAARRPELLPPPAEPRRRTWTAAAAVAPVAAALAAVAVLTLAGWNVFLLRDNRRLAADLAAADARRSEEARGVESSLGQAERRLGELAELAGRQTERIALLQGEVETLRAPRLNVPVLDLDPSGGGIARGGGPAQALQVPPDANLLTLILNLSERPAPGRYTLEILAADGRQVWSGAGLEPTQWDTFSLTVPRSLLPDGRYRLRLLRQGRQIETYEIATRASR